MKRGRNQALFILGCLAFLAAVWGSVDCGVRLSQAELAAEEETHLRHLIYFHFAVAQLLLAAAGGASRPLSCPHFKRGHKKGTLKKYCSMFTGVFQRAAIKNGEVMVKFSAKGKSRLCVSVRCFGRRGRQKLKGTK